MSMTLEKLRAVRAEMDRLEDRLRTLIAAEEVALEWRERGDWLPLPTRGSAESGAVRRASLDLTRALAELRKP